MKCPICKHGETAANNVTVTLDRDKATIVFRNVPADVCRNCGEEYVDEKTTASLMETAEKAAQAGTLVDVIEYKAA